MSSIVLGKSANKNVRMDIDILLATRLLIQANSGGGKSWLLRRLAEQLFGKIPVLIIDPEGEFATLREKFDYFLVGQGGDIPADLRSARLLAEKFLELRASAVCDLYEAFRSKPLDQRAWVRAFLETIMDAPKKFWRPLVIIVDEAHKFCPQEAPKGRDMREREMISGTKDAMISVATAGRKRGFVPIWATQRLAKVDKDASAELLNRIVGMTIEDVDVDRAAELMSVSREDRNQFKASLKTLEPGQMYAFGRAISKERLLMKVGNVETTHPESGAGKHTTEPPPAPEKIKALLPKLADLPKAAEEKAKTEAELRAEVRSLKAQLRSQPVKPETKPIPVADPRAIERVARPLRAALEEAMKVMLKISAVGFDDDAMKSEEITKALQATAKEISRLAKAGLDKRFAEFEKLKREANRVLAKMKQLLSQETLEVRAELKRHEPFTLEVPIPQPRRGVPGFDADSRLHGLKRGAIKMLQTLAAWHPDSLTRDQLGILAGFAPSGGTFSEYMSLLRRRALIHEDGERVAISEEGLKASGNVPPRPESTHELVEMWKGKFKAGVGKMLDVLVARYPEEISREDLGQESGFASSGGTFGEYLSYLRRARLIEEIGGKVRASIALFID